MKRVFLVLAVLLVTGAASLWLARSWLGEKAAEAMRSQLAARGVHVSWDSAALLPGFGISFEGLKWHRAAGGEGLLLAWDKAQVKRGEKGWTSARVQTQDSVLDVGEGETALRLEDLELAVHVDRDGVELERLLGRVRGLQLDVAGAVSFARLRGLRADAGADTASSPGAAADKDKVEAAAESPLAALAGLGAWLPEGLDERRPLTLKARLTEAEGDAGCRLRIDLDSGPLKWRGQALPGLGVTADWLMLPGERQPVYVSRLTTAPEATGQKLEAVVDLEKSEVFLKAEGWVLHPLPLVLAAAPALRESLAALSLEGPVRLRAEGVIPWEKPAKLELAGRLATTGTTRLALGERRELPLEGLETEFRHAGGEWVLRETGAGLWGGRLSLAETRVQPEKRTWRTEGVRLQGVQIPRMTHSLGWEAEQAGELHVSWQGGGGFELASLRGGGSLEVTNAAFYRLPLLGPLHLIFDRLAPGFAKDTASRLEMQHTIQNGILGVRQARVQSAITEIQVEGDLDLNRQYAKLTARAQLRGIVGLPTVLLGMLLALDGEGPFSNIEWRLRHTPGLEMVTGVVGAVGGTVLSVGGAAGGVVKGVGGTAVDAASSAVKGAGKAAGKAAEGAGKAAKGILNLPGRLLKKKD